ncbi:hypothetical protein FBZ83_103373 [Azospirillum brasilense]|uniref:Uncharacterized protein n=1 Tax=Azospirillum brasilense TaxID=192 RepID=A0A560CLM6_AZOBR|nr:hypothetical protein [Azospirillum brasilense]MBK3732360.1 hypothetical protein [Azospirillum brasilense]TWA85780.1 hypothetical protein FBZ83_103373 [Azospirillum brasilense]
MTTATFRIIRHADGSVFFEDRTITLAEAQILINDAIARGDLEVGSFLRIDGDELVVEREIAG